jgi:hypothetical protein
LSFEFDAEPVELDAQPALAGRLSSPSRMPDTPRAPKLTLPDARHSELDARHPELDVRHPELDAPPLEPDSPPLELDAPSSFL